MYCTSARLSRILRRLRFTSSRILASNLPTSSSESLTPRLRRLRITTSSTIRSVIGPQRMATLCPRFKSETDTDAHLVCARRDEVRAGERRQKVVQRVVVGHVQDTEAESHLRLLAVEQIVSAKAEVYDVSRRHSGRIVHIGFAAVGGNGQALRSVRRRAALNR